MRVNQLERTDLQLAIELLKAQPQGNSARKFPVFPGRSEHACRRAWPTSWPGYAAASASLISARRADRAMAISILRVSACASCTGKFTCPAWTGHRPAPATSLPNFSASSCLVCGTLQYITHQRGQDGVVDHPPTHRTGHSQRLGDIGLAYTRFCCACAWLNTGGFYSFNIDRAESDHHSKPDRRVPHQAVQVHGTESTASPPYVQAWPRLNTSRPLCHI